MVAELPPLGDPYRYPTQLKTMTDKVTFTYTPATISARDSNGPISGTALFRDVPYRFFRCLDSPPSGVGSHEWFVLEPVDPNTGLEMMAVGRFRADDAVWWNSFGSPTLNNQSDNRQMFIEFLNRLVAETATRAHYDAFCIAHYADNELEHVRRECVRLFLDRESIYPLDNHERGTLKRLTDTLSKNVG